MAVRRRSCPEPLLNRVLARARELAAQVREAAERVHQQAEEAHRLTEIARRQAERGQELSKAGREEACAVVDSLRWSVDITGNGKRPISPATTRLDWVYRSYRKKRSPAPP
jgi:hypothetical protein